MKFWIGLVVGAVAGAVGGYLKAKKDFDKQFKEAAEKLEKQYQERLAKEREEVEETAKAEAEEDKKKAVVEALKRVEIEDTHVNDGVDINALADEEEEEDDEDDLLIPDWDPGDGSEFIDPNEEWKAYFESINEYVGSARPYNITEEMFSEDKLEYNKVKVYIHNKDENHDEYAYDAETGAVLDNYHLLIGDNDFDTLAPARCDHAAWFVRNDREQTDFMIQYDSSALLR